MKRRKKIIAGKDIIATIVMMLALLWLTVSTPFVYTDEVERTEFSKKYQDKESAEESDNPFSTAEEKVEKGSGTSSEYLHEYFLPQHSAYFIGKFFKCHPSDLYFAYHPELISPPPEV